MPWSRFPTSIICHFLAQLTAQWEEHKEMKNLMSPEVTHANISQVLTPMENYFFVIELKKSNLNRAFSDQGML